MSEEGKATIQYSVSTEAAHRAVTFDELDGKPLEFLDRLADLFAVMEDGDLHTPEDLESESGLSLAESEASGDSYPLLDILAERGLLKMESKNYRKNW